MFRLSGETVVTWVYMSGRGAVDAETISLSHLVPWFQYGLVLCNTRPSKPSECGVDLLAGATNLKTSNDDDIFNDRLVAEQ